MGGYFVKDKKTFPWCLHNLELLNDIPFKAEMAAETTGDF